MNIATTSTAIFKNALFLTIALSWNSASAATYCHSPERECIYAQQQDSVSIEMELPERFQAISPEQLGHPNLKRLIFNDLTYIGAYTFTDCSSLEEVIFKGAVSHTDGYVFDNCPKLRRIVFEGPVFSTGGPGYAKNCPELTEVVFKDLVLNTNLAETTGCPKFEGFKITGKVLHSSNTDIIPQWQADISDSCSLFRIERCLRDILEKKYDNEFSDPLIRIAYHYSPLLWEAMNDAGLTAEADSFKVYYESYENMPGTHTSMYLDTLKQSAPYKKADLAGPQFIYMHRNDSILKATREYFNLDSIAGNGNDISRISNLMFWLHDLVRHDGSSSWPDCHYNAPALYEVCVKENRGLNCRFLAMMLTECLLAEGIPARYLTCQSKEYATDSDCHVICIAWSKSLGKWVWVDPSFAAFVYDQNGTMLHPGQVREYLQKGLPLKINEEANWNHKNSVDIEEYLYSYMAKNLYIIECNIVNKGEPEGKYATGKTETVCLVPEGFQYHTSATTDDAYFWQPPKMPKRIKRGK